MDVIDLIKTKEFLLENIEAKLAFNSHSNPDSSIKQRPKRASHQSQDRSQTTNNNSGQISSQKMEPIVPQKNRNQRNTFEQLKSLETGNQHVKQEDPENKKLYRKRSTKSEFGYQDVIEKYENEKISKSEVAVDAYRNSSPMERAVLDSENTVKKQGLRGDRDCYGMMEGNFDRLEFQFRNLPNLSQVESDKGLRKNLFVKKERNIKSQLMSDGSNGEDFYGLVIYVGEIWSCRV